MKTRIRLISMERQQVTYLLLFLIGVLAVSVSGQYCTSQNDCIGGQCCVNENSWAKSGVCLDRPKAGATCHNPRSTGFHYAGCEAPPGIIHPELCPCTCGEFCALGFNPKPNAHGGYKGTCSFG